MFFAKSIRRFIGKNINGKYSQKLFGHAKQSATNTLKAASWEAIEKTAEATDDLFGNKTADEITKVWKSSPQNNSETVESEIENTGFDKETPKERYTSPEKRQQIIHDLRLI